MIINIARNDSWKCSEVDENFKLADLRSSVTPSTKNMKKMTKRHIIIKQLKISDKELERKDTLYTKEQT